MKLARYASDGTIDAPVVLVQAFTEYYDLDGGGHSSKRENAEFVGRLAADSLDDFAYSAVDLAFEPSVRGGDRPDGWASAVEPVAEAVVDVAARE